MSGWTGRTKGNVAIIHHSTISEIEIRIETQEEVEESKWEDVTKSIWVDYETFRNLAEVIEDVDFPKNKKPDPEHRQQLERLSEIIFSISAHVPYTYDEEVSEAQKIIDQIRQHV